MRVKKQTGATLLEVLAFLGVAALILIGAISMFRSAQGSQQANEMQSQLTGLRTNIKALNPNQTTFGSATWPSSGSGTQGMNQLLIQAKALPDTLRGQTAAPWNIGNTFGGQVLVDGGPSGYWIVYTGVPQEACIKLAPQTNAGWDGLRINNNAEVSTIAAAFPVATAVAQCTAGITNTMVWRGH